jgi:hypothetical protein
MGGDERTRGWTADYRWLDNFWDEVVAEREGRTWILATLYDKDILLRDGLAHALAFERLGSRRDVDCTFVQAWTREREPVPRLGQDVLFIGRAKPFARSGLGLLAVWLEAKACGLFLDHDEGTTGNVVRYGKAEFARHELEGPPELWRRCDVDYGVLLFRTDGERRVAALSGLSTLGTLGLTLLLTDDRLRREFVQQVRHLAPWHERLHPEVSFEICVRIQVEGAAGLANFLNTRAFDFRVEAVAIAKGDGAQPWVQLNPQSEPELRLVPGTNGGGTVSLHGAEVRLPTRRFKLLRRLVESQRTSTADLCHYLGFANGVRGKPNGREKIHLAKLVHDLNGSLARLPLPGRRLVRFSKQAHRYVLSGVRVTIVAAPQRDERAHAKRR